MISQATPNTTCPTSLSHCAFPRTGKRGVPQQFPRRLYEMLDSETRNIERCPNYPQIISWSLSGKAFRIFDVAEFATTILPKYFRTKKFSSFQRNLNLYGFAKVRRGADTDMYAHPSFMRDHPDSLVELRKVTGVGIGSTSTSSPSIQLRRQILSETIPASPTTQTTVDADKPRARLVSPTMSTSNGNHGSAVLPQIPPTVPRSEVPFIPCPRTLDSRILAKSRQYIDRYHQEGNAPQRKIMLPLPSLQLNRISTDTPVPSGGDRGKLDLLAMALEYDCLNSTRVKSF